MKLIDTFAKTRWSYLIVIVVLGLVVSGGLLLVIFSDRYSESPSGILNLPKERYVSATVQELKLNPLQWHTRQIVVEGIYRWGFEDSNFDETADSEEYNIWIETTENTDLENIPSNYLDYRSFSGSGSGRTLNPYAKATIYGTFHAYDPNAPMREFLARGNFGHLGLWKHEIAADKITFESDKSSGGEFQAKIIGSYSSPGESSKVAVKDSVVFLTDISEGLLAIDVSDPTKPKLLDSLKIAGGGAYAVAVHRSSLGNVLVGGYGNAKIALVDASDPKNLRMKAEGDAKRSVQDITQAGSSWYLAIDGPEFEIFSDALKSLGTVKAALGGHILSLDIHETVRSVFQEDFNLWVSFQKLVVAQGERGLAIFDLLTTPPQLQGSMELGGYGYAVGTDNDSSQAKSLVYMLSAQDLIIVDIADAENPKIKEKISLAGSGEAIDLTNGIAAVAMWEKGVELINVQNPDNPVSLGIVDTPGRARDVAIQQKGDRYYIYVADDRDDLQIITIDLLPKD